MKRLQQTAVSVKRSVLSWDLRKLSVKLAALAFILALASGVLWYRNIYLNEERRFWLAIDNSMSTPSVVRTLTTGGTGNQVVQHNRFLFSPVNLAQSRVEFTNRSATANTTVVTEGISTLDSQFSRYVQFETDDPREDGTLPDLDEVLNRWSGQTVSEEERDNARLNYLSELVTLAVFGNFDPAYRAQVTEAFRSSETYQISMQNVQTENVDGEEVLLYPVSVGLRSYAEQLQASFVRSGLGEFPPLDPDNYAEDSRVNAQFTVRKRDSAIIGITFGDRQEQFGNYGVQLEVEIPTPEFTPQQLEQQVQSSIQG